MGGSVNGIRAWLSELRRRGVFHVTGLYAVGAWAVVQLVDAISGPFPLPEAALRLIWFAALLGFPVALVFGWRYDITKKGIVRTHRRLTHGEDVPIGRADYGFIGAVALVMVGIVGVTAVRVLDAIEEATLEAAVAPEIFEPPANSVAVLAFENMSAEPEREYFSDGISEEILNILAQIKGLKVIARQSSFSFKGKDADIATMARQLHVRYILEGSVRSSGDRVRITAQLIDAKDSSHLWSEAFDLEYDAQNLFNIQIKIARAIADRVGLTFTGDDEARLARVPTENTEAYTAYLIGRDRLRDSKVAGLEEAVEQFAKAIDLDDQFAGAYSGLVDACLLYWSHSGGHRHEHCPDGLEAFLRLAQKAVALDENLSEGWVSLGELLTVEARNLPQERPRSEIVAKFEEAHAAFERGLDLNKSYIQGYLWYAGSLSSPRLYDSWDSWLEAWKADTWQSIARDGLVVDPLSIQLHDMLSDAPMWARTIEEALYHARKIVEIEPDSPMGHERLAQLSWIGLGRIDESIRSANNAARIDPRNPRYASHIALGYATLGDLDMAMAYWERAGQIAANEYSSEKFHILRALILLSDKHGVRMQQVFDALEPIDVGSPNRMEIEANLALINGEANEWRDGHAEYLSECLTAEIDQTYLEKWHSCGTWLDGLLQATGDEARAQAVTKMRIPWDQKWAEWQGRGSVGDPRDFMILGEDEMALDAFEITLAKYRGNPYLFRVYLKESLRFMMYHDPLLSPIRDHPRFQAVVAEVEADLAQQLENVREMEQRGELPTLEEVRALVAAKQEGD